MPFRPAGFGQGCETLPEISDRYYLILPFAVPVFLRYFSPLPLRYLTGFATTGNPVAANHTTGFAHPESCCDFQEVIRVSTHRRQARIDFTLTLPGMFELRNIEKLSIELGVDILAKVVFSFSPDIILSPLALPKDVLHPWIDELLVGQDPAGHLQNSSLRDILIQLKTRPTFQEQYPDSWKSSLAEGKRRMLQLENIRQDELTLADILSERKDAFEWYQSING